MSNELWDAQITVCLSIELLSYVFKFDLIGRDFSSWLSLGSWVSSVYSLCCLAGCWNRNEYWLFLWVFAEGNFSLVDSIISPIHLMIDLQMSETHFKFISYPVSVICSKFCFLQPMTTGSSGWVARLSCMRSWIQYLQSTWEWKDCWRGRYMGWFVVHGFSLVTQKERGSKYCT